MEIREEIRNGEVRHSRDDMASEVEMGDLLYGLVRMIKPRLVVETGFYFGDTARGIIRALMENDCGRYVGCDINGTYIQEAQQAFYCSYAGERSEFRCCRSEELPELAEADLIYSDSGGGDEGGDPVYLRRTEYEMAKSGCYYVAHDTQWAPLADWMRSIGGLIFPCGRGFGLAVKP